MIVAVLLAACVDGADRGVFVPVDGKGWAYTDTLELSLPKYQRDDSACVLNGGLSVAIRHTDSYPYSNIWLELSYPDSTDGMANCDTVQIELCDRYGRWYGKGIGSLYQISVPLKREVAIAGDSPLRLRHIMRVDTLRGIESAGVVFNSVK